MQSSVPFIPLRACVPARLFHLNLVVQRDRLRKRKGQQYRLTSPAGASMMKRKKVIFYIYIFFIVFQSVLSVCLFVVRLLVLLPLLSKGRSFKNYTCYRSSAYVILRKSLVIIKKKSTK